MACFAVGDLVYVYFHQVDVEGEVTKVVKVASTCARSQFMVHEHHTTVDGRHLVHDKLHYGSALRHRS